MNLNYSYKKDNMLKYSNKFSLESSNDIFFRNTIFGTEQILNSEFSCNTETIKISAYSFFHKNMILQRLMRNYLATTYRHLFFDSEASNFLNFSSKKSKNFVYCKSVFNNLLHGKKMKMSHIFFSLYIKKVDSNMTFIYNIDNFSNFKDLFVSKLVTQKIFKNFFFKKELVSLKCAPVDYDRPFLFFKSYKRFKKKLWFNRFKEFLIRMPLIQFDRNSLVSHLDGLSFKSTSLFFFKRIFLIRFFCKFLNKEKKFMSIIKKNYFFENKFVNFVTKKGCAKIIRYFFIEDKRRIAQTEEKSFFLRLIWKKRSNLFLEKMSPYKRAFSKIKDLNRSFSKFIKKLQGFIFIALKEISFFSIFSKSANIFKILKKYHTLSIFFLSVISSDLYCNEKKRLYSYRLFSDRSLMGPSKLFENLWLSALSKFFKKKNLFDELKIYFDSQFDVISGIKYGYFKRTKLKMELLMKLLMVKRISINKTRMNSRRLLVKKKVIYKKNLQERFLQKIYNALFNKIWHYKNSKEYIGLEKTFFITNFMHNRINIRTQIYNKLVDLSNKALNRALLGRTFPKKGKKLFFDNVSNFFPGIYFFRIRPLYSSYFLRSIYFTKFLTKKFEDCIVKISYEPTKLLFQEESNLNSLSQMFFKEQIVFQREEWLIIKRLKKLNRFFIKFRKYNIFSKNLARIHITKNSSCLYFINKNIQKRSLSNLFFDTRNVIKILKGYFNVWKKNSLKINMKDYSNLTFSKFVSSFRSKKLSHKYLFVNCFLLSNFSKLLKNKILDLPFKYQQFNGSFKAKNLMSNNNLDEKKVFENLKKRILLNPNELRERSSRGEKKWKKTKFRKKNRPQNRQLLFFHFVSFATPSFVI